MRRWGEHIVGWEHIVHSIQPSSTAFQPPSWCGRPPPPCLLWSLQRVACARCLPPSAARPDRRVGPLSQARRARVASSLSCVCVRVPQATRQEALAAQGWAWRRRATTSVDTHASAHARYALPIVPQPARPPPCPPNADCPAYALHHTVCALTSSRPRRVVLSSARRPAAAASRRPS